MFWRHVLLSAHLEIPSIFSQIVAHGDSSGAAATAPASARAQQATLAADSVTADALEAAQQLIGLGLPRGERESARPLVSRNRDNYESIRKLSIPELPASAIYAIFQRPHCDAAARG